VSNHPRLAPFRMQETTHSTSVISQQAFIFNDTTMTMSKLAYLDLSEEDDETHENS
jgi:hypothetical protein